MNINLLAPTNKCSDFNVSFKEPIVIEKNSKVQFNWAKLSRHNGIVLDKDENIIIEPALPIPSRIPNAPGTLNLNGDSFATSNLVVIPKGNYTGKELQRIITDKINDFVGATPGIAHQAGFNTTGQLSGIDQEFTLGTNNKLKIGLETKPVQGRIGYRQTNFANNNRFARVSLDVENHFNSTLTNEYQLGAEGNIKKVRYRKTAQRATVILNNPLKYDNYAMSQEHLIHYAVNSLDSISDRLLKQDANTWKKNWILENGVYAESVKTLGEYNAIDVVTPPTPNPDYRLDQQNIYLGLYSREVATAGTTIRDDSATDVLDIRTGGTTANAQGTGTFNPQINSNGSPNSFPVCYVSVEIGKEFSASAVENTTYPHKDYIIVRAGQKGAGANDTLSNIEISDSVDDMEIIHIARISDFTSDSNYKPKIFLSTYYKQNPNFDRNVKPTATNTTSTALLDESLLFFKVYLIGCKEEDESELLYDSGINGNYGFKHSFFNKYEDIGADTQSALRINTQLPFNVLFSAQKIADGWDNIAIKGMNKDAVGGGDNNPNTIIRGYRFILPNIIARMINPAIATTLSTEFLYPTAQTTTLYDVNDNEEIRIDDITSSFKDDDVSIYLDNLPLENYKNTELSLNKGLKKNLLVNIPSPFSDTTQSGILLTSKYSPNTPFITDLKNQEFKTNNLRILIKDGKTDRPINDLISASVDFTILKE